MPDTSKLSKYLKPEHVQDGDVITFVDAGVIFDRTFGKGDDEEAKPVLEMTVKFRDENKTYSPNGTSVKLLNAAWGPNTEAWVSKRATLTVVPHSSGHNMIVAKPKVA